MERLNPRSTNWSFVWGSAPPATSHDPGTCLLLESTSARRFDRACRTTTWRGFCQVLGVRLGQLQATWPDDMAAFATEQGDPIRADSPYDHRASVGLYHISDLIPDPRVGGAMALLACRLFQDHVGDDIDIATGVPGSDFMEAVAPSPVHMERVAGRLRAAGHRCRRSDALVDRWMHAR